jgi:T5SS/PEP-CTERM-associated repeat protein
MMANIVGGRRRIIVKSNHLVLACVAILLLLAVIAATSAAAVTTNWNTDSSGSFSTTANWDNGVPGSEDLAVFNRGVGVGYTVTFNGTLPGFPAPLYLVDRVQIRSNDVTFERGLGLVGASFGAGEPFLVAPGKAIVVGLQTGDVATFTTNIPISAAAVTIAQAASSIAGVHINSFTWTLSGDDSSLIVGNSGFGTLSINNGAQLRIIGSTSSSQITLGYNIGGSGGLIVSGSGSEVHFDNVLNGFLQVGRSGTAQLTITGGGKIIGNLGNTGGGIGPGSTASIDGAGSSWSMTNSLDVVGTLTTLNGGTVSANTIDVFPGGVVNGNGTIAGRLENTDQGFVAPGFPIGALHVTGSFEQVNASDLQIQISGTTAGTQYDQLLVTGMDTLGGTLDVSLINGFIPHRGDSFEILHFGSVTGKFSTINLPTLPSGLGWNTTQLYKAGVLSVQLVGDYNGNGFVDAADYTLWRDTLGSTTNLAADGNGNGGVDSGDYNVWKENFGNHSGAGSGANASISEPSTILLLTTAGFLLTFSRTLTLRCVFTVPRFVPIRQCNCR